MEECFKKVVQSNSRYNFNVKTKIYQSVPQYKADLMVPEYKVDLAQAGWGDAVPFLKVKSNSSINLWVGNEKRIEWPGEAWIRSPGFH